ncbi:pleckstrin homology domain-containing family O member 2 [Anguilla rostrata]|uniref:pleckstrin homology domain-containing family O member 2 n=1 Tax=Anguilla rostrata TaxID=7938 RepID=UPI0030D1A46F
MEDGVKEDTAKPEEVKFIGKAGWVKKCYGKFLGSYKDRYIQLEKTEIAVYESEDLKNCLERVDLENYEKCTELRSAFKKKNRLILIRAQKCGNKIHDVKIQAQNPEDKDSWIKALSDGINRTKNKIFDEVKVDESCTLEHVTRTRPKGNQSRRPPTRIRMKEAANLSTDGILRKDLDASDNTPNGTHQVNTEVDTSKEAVKPPMPPSKPREKLQEIPEEEPAPQKNVLKPPMPPSKESKPSSSGEGETPKEVVLAPPMPPNKARDSSEESDSTRITPSSPSPIKDPTHPPMPPSKDKKPAQTVEWEVPQLSCGAEDSEEERPEETFSDDQGKNDKLGSEGDSTPPPQTAVTSPEAKLDSTVPEEADETTDEKEGSCPTQEEPDHSNVALEAEGNPAPAIASSADTQRPATPLTKSTEPSLQPAKKTPGPPALPKKKSLTRSEGDQPCDPREGSAEVPISVESRGAGLPNESVPASGISDLSKHRDDLTPTAESKNKMVALSTGDIAADDDELQHGDGSEAEAEPAEAHVPQKWKVVTGARSRAQMLKPMQIKRSMQPIPPALPLKPSKGKSASVGDLLSESVVQTEEWAFKEISSRNDTNELRNKVALELEETAELLSTVSSRQEAQGSLGDKGGPKSLSPEELLAKAVEQLRKADQCLQEAKNLKQAQPVEKRHRMSL